MDATTYRPEAAAPDERAEDTCETETTPVFRRADRRTTQRLHLLAQAAGNTGRALKPTGR